MKADPSWTDQVIYDNRTIDHIQRQPIKSKMKPGIHLVLCCVLLFGCVIAPALAFVAPWGTTTTRQSALQLQESSPKQVQQAQDLLEKARKLRQEIDEASRDGATKKAAATSRTKQATTFKAVSSPWSLVNQDSDVTSYRFYIDIGREEGTWMEARWGASGQRIEFSLDVAFTTEAVNRTVADQMVQDNRGRGRTSKSPVYRLDVAPFARLRGGFDRMKCEPGAYRLDTSNNRGQKTLRIFFYTEGKTMGDVSVPEKNNLYISLPVLADSSLSRKEGIVSVRQFGWHTGLYRQESRIVGVVKAAPLKEARANDGF